MLLSDRPKLRPILALAAVVGLAAAALPAGAATTSTPARGTAKSTLTVLQLKVEDTTVVAGRVAAVANDAADPHVAKLVVTPVSSSVTGPVGQQTITPQDGATTVPSTPKSVDLPAGLGSVTGPTFTASAVDTADKVLASATLKALGSVTLVTVPLELKAASLSDVSRVTADGATARKKLSVGSLALPSLQDLLAGLGVDLDALLDQLTQGKLTQLAGLVTSTTSGAVKAANDAVDAAQAGVAGTAPKTMAGAQDALTSAQSDLTAAQSTLTSATNAFATAYDAVPDAGLTALGVPVSLTADQFLALSPALQGSVDALSGADLVALATAVADAQAVVDTAQALVDSVQALVTALADLLAAVLDALANSDDPLAALGDVTVLTSAKAAQTPTAAADVSVGSISVLGATTALAQLTNTLGSVTGTLSNVLNSVAGVSFTAPEIAVGTPAHSTSQQGRTRYATASITGLTVTLPSITLPNALSVAGVPTSISGNLKVGVLAETAKWTPASSQASAPGSPSQPNGGPLPDTGAPWLISLAGLLAVGLALALRRFRAGSAVDG